MIIIITLKAKNTREHSLVSLLTLLIQEMKKKHINYCNFVVVLFQNSFQKYFFLLFSNFARLQNYPSGYSCPAQQCASTGIRWSTVGNLRWRNAGIILLKIRIPVICLYWRSIARRQLFASVDYQYRLSTIDHHLSIQTYSLVERKF